MIDHVSHYAHDFAAAKQFFDAALGALGYTVQMELVSSWDPEFPTRRMAGYGDKRPVFWLLESKEPRSPQHIAFKAASREAVQAFYDAGLAHGGRDNGAPGPRPHYHASYYGGFLFDPEGNNVEAVTHVPV